MQNENHTPIASWPSKATLFAKTLLTLFLGAASAQASTNVLTNPGFEIGTAAGWTTYGSHAVESTNNQYYNGGNPGASNVLTHSGQYVGKSWGMFNGNFNVNGFYQDVVAGPGSIWSADGFALSHEQDLMQSGNQFWIELTFRDGADAVLGMYRSAILDPAVEALATNQWVQLEVTNVYDVADPTYQTITNTASSFSAPEGTTKARFQIVFAQLGGYPGGSVYFDDLRLSKVAGSDPDITASPASLKKVEGQTASFSVAAVGGTALRYQWQKDGVDLSDGGNVSGATSATLMISNLALSDAGKYTVVVSDQAGSVTSAAADLVVTSVAEAANVLDNPGFEAATEAPWQRFNGGGLVTSVAEGILEGTRAGETWGTGAGTWNGIYQDVTATPGEGFSADGWFLVSADAVIDGTSEAWLEVQFLDASGNTVGLYRSDHITVDTPVGTWMNLQATNVIRFWDDYGVDGQATTLIAPATASKVRYQVTYHAGEGGGAVLYDKMNLSAKSPVQLKLTREGNVLSLGFQTQPGLEYEVMYTESLAGGAWQSLKKVTGDLAGQASVSDNLGTTQRFYRVNTL